MPGDACLGEYVRRQDEQFRFVQRGCPRGRPSVPRGRRRGSHKRIRSRCNLGNVPVHFREEAFGHLLQSSVGARKVEVECADGIAAEDTLEFSDLAKQYQQSTFGAHFVEVGVDLATGKIRIRRMLAVCAAGRILNPKSARSQVIGAMTMGAGAALMEELAVDKRRGFFVNHDLAGYEVPVHADIPHQEVIFLDETDPISSPMKAKGVGELGICGVGAAVANAIYNATGVRVRDYPITLDKLIDRLPQA